LDIGHLPPQIPMMSGAYAKIAVENGKFKIDYELK